MRGFEGFGYLVLATLLDMAVLTMLIRRSSRDRFQPWGESATVALLSAFVMFYASCWANGSGRLALPYFVIGLGIVAISLTLLCRLLTHLTNREALKTALLFAIIKLSLLAVFYFRHKELFDT